jgi:hypothetical protein
MVRLTDKMSRLSSIIESGKTNVKDESFEDTMVDVINYIVLLSAYRQDKRILAQYGEITYIDTMMNYSGKELS